MGTRIVTKFAPGYSECNNPLQDCMGCDDSVVLHLNDEEVITDPTYPSYSGKYTLLASVISAQGSHGPSQSDPNRVVRGLAFQFQYDEDAVTRPITECDICQFSCLTCSIRDYLEKDNSVSPYAGSGDGGEGIQQTRYCFDFTDECVEFPVEVTSILGCAGMLFNHEDDGKVSGESGQLLADALNCKPETSALGWWQWSDDDKTLCVYSFGKAIKSLNIQSANGKELCLEAKEVGFNDPLAAYQQASFDYTKKNIIRALGTADCFTDDGDDVSDGGDDSGDCAYDEEFSEEFMRRLALHLKCGKGQPNGEAGVGHRVWEIDEETDINSVTAHPDGSPLIEGGIVFKGKGSICERMYTFDGTDWAGPIKKNAGVLHVLESPVTLVSRTGFGSVSAFIDYEITEDPPCEGAQPILKVTSNNALISIISNLSNGLANNANDLTELSGAGTAVSSADTSVWPKLEFKYRYYATPNVTSPNGRIVLVGWKI